MKNNVLRTQRTKERLKEQGLTVLIYIMRMIAVEGEEVCDEHKEEN